MKILIQISKLDQRKSRALNLVGALMKFHHRSIARLTTKFRKLEQAKTRKINVIELSKNRELVVYTQSI